MVDPGFVPNVALDAQNKITLPAKQPNGLIAVGGMLAAMLGWPISLAMAFIGIGEDLNPATRAASQHSKQVTEWILLVIVLVLFWGGMSACWYARKNAPVASGVGIVLGGMWILLMGYVLIAVRVF